MIQEQLNRVNLLSRAGLDFVFFYHGLVPKILWLSAIEREIVETHGFNANTLSPAAGVMEILLAASILFIRRSTIPIYLSAFLLVALLIDIVLVAPKLLIEAFNPVSINLVSLLLCYLVVLTQTEFLGKARSCEVAESPL